MTKGDRFVWLHSEKDHRFGEKCEVVAVMGDRVLYRFADRPNWKESVMPIAWAKCEKNYSPEEIKAIQKRRKRRRIAGIF